jgi:hypothetical protein
MAEFGENNGWAYVKFENGSCIRSDSAEAHLLLAILEKLEEVRCGIIDVEDSFAESLNSGDSENDK